MEEDGRSMTDEESEGRSRGMVLCKPRDSVRSSYGCKEAVGRFLYWQKVVRFFDRSLLQGAFPLCPLIIASAIRDKPLC